MSRTRHLTFQQVVGDAPRPSQRRPRTKLTRSSEWLPDVPRPKNEGTRRVPCGGYAASRKAHALAKKIGKRRMRRRGWVLP